MNDGGDGGKKEKKISLPTMPRVVSHCPEKGGFNYEKRSGGTVLRGLDDGWRTAVFELSPLSAGPRVPAAIPLVHQHLAGLDHVKTSERGACAACGMPLLTDVFLP